MMMPPPTLVHQRIAGNLEALINAKLSVVKPDWRADREIGVLLPDDDRFNPEPDVTVIDTSIGLGQVYAQRFYFVAEVLSPSDRPEQRAGSDKPVVLAAKLDYYRAHSHCHGVLIVHQDRIEAELFARDGNIWSARTLSDPADRLVIPEIGDVGIVGDLYRHTPLYRAMA
jgi:Uma2 family endonuclease